MFKNSHRAYTTGFYYGEKDNVCLDTSQPACDYDFIARVKGYDKDKKMLAVEMRNRFRKGDVLEVLSPDDRYFDKNLRIDVMYDEDMVEVEDAKRVQQILYVPTDFELSEGDILRKKQNNQ